MRYKFLPTFAIAILFGLLALSQSLLTGPLAVADAADWTELSASTSTTSTTSTLTPTVGFSSLFLPMLINLSNDDVIDDVINRLEVTQAIQTSSNDVPLVANRPTMLRIYASANKKNPAEQVYVSIEASRNGVPLPQSPLVIGPTTVHPSPSSAELDSTINSLLPAEWLSGRVTLDVTINSTAAIRDHESNNSALMVLRFNSVPPLDIKIVPINYTDISTGATYHHDDSSKDAISDAIRNYIMRIYPIDTINLSFRAAVNFEGDLSQRFYWRGVLANTHFVKLTDDAPDSQVYYGIVPPGDYDPALAGIADLRYRASAGMGYPDFPTGTGHIAAHEIAHNFGRRHTPCRKGDTEGYDQNYPYPEGAIGHYGLDISANEVYSPDSAKDFMAPCLNKWVSDYTYRALYSDQRRNGRRRHSVSATENLLIRVSFDDDDTPTIEPLYTLSTRRITTPPSSSDYRIELWGTNGELLASHSVPVYEMQDVEGQGIIAALPHPKQAIAAVHLLQAGTLVAQRTLTAHRAAEAPTIEQTTDHLTLRWHAPTVPALVRYTADEGQTWTTVAFDLLGGELQLDPKTLPNGPGYFEITFADNATAASLKVEWPMRANENSNIRISGASPR